MICDFLFFLLALLIVGFEAMIFNLWIGTLAYSLYLTLREWIVVLYCVFKVLGAFSLLFGRDTSQASTQI